MKKLEYSSTTSPVFKFNLRKTEKLSQNINLNFHNTDKVSCNELPNFDQNSPLHHTYSYTQLPKMDGLVQRDSKIKNIMEQSKKSSLNINRSVPEFNNAQLKQIFPTPDSVTSSNNNFISPTISIYEYIPNISPNMSETTNIGLFHILEASSSNNFMGENTFDISSIQFSDPLIDKNCNEDNFVHTCEHDIFNKDKIICAHYVNSICFESKSLSTNKYVIAEAPCPHIKIKIGTKTIQIRKRMMKLSKKI